MLGLLMDGGWMMLPLLLCSILGLAVIIDRMRAFKAAGEDYEGLRKTVRGKLEEGDVMAALEAAGGAKGPVAATFVTGLNRFVRQMGKGKAADEAATAAVRSMEEYAPKALKPLEVRLNLLVLVAAIMVAHNGRKAIAETHGKNNNKGKHHIDEAGGRQLLHTVMANHQCIGKS